MAASVANDDRDVRTADNLFNLHRERWGWSINYFIILLWFMSPSMLGQLIIQRLSKIQSIILLKINNSLTDSSTHSLIYSHTHLVSEYVKNLVHFMQKLFHQSYRRVPTQRCALGGGVLIGDSSVGVGRKLAVCGRSDCRRRRGRWSRRLDFDQLRRCG